MLVKTGGNEGYETSSSDISSAASCVGLSRKKRGKKAAGAKNMVVVIRCIERKTEERKT